MPIKLSSLPDPPKEYVSEFPRLDGGLNLSELPYRLDADESPDMVNLWWRDGALCSRDGQTRLTSEEALGSAHSAYGGVFWGYGFFHVGDALYCAPLDDPDLPAGELALSRLLGEIPEEVGAWFRYGDALYYKNPGRYVEILYDPAAGEGEIPFSAADVEAYQPVILINAEPTECAGDVYQPENRLSPAKTVWYTAALSEELDLDSYETGDALLAAINEAMKAGKGISVYHLPVQDIDSVDYVEVDGVEIPVVDVLPGQTEGEGETEGEEGEGEEGEEPAGPSCCVADLAAGTVEFDVAPRYHWPVQPNTVKITYSKENGDAYRSIMECKYAAVFGGDRNVCVVLAGSPAQPNAYYWCGNHTAMDPGYFPMEQYNLAGDTEEEITGFGKQQAMLVIFKAHSVGRASFGTTEMGSGRVLLTMDYTAINSRIGCDLPGTIQLIENNLVFANSAQGVFLIRDTSSAYENNIVGISRKVDGAPLSKGLLFDLRNAWHVTSFDDDQRYWLCADEAAYCWDYTLSGYDDPSWCYLSGMKGMAYVAGEAASYHLDKLGRVSVLRRNWTDYGGPIHKKYRFAVQHMGSYDRLKDVLRCEFTVRGDTDSTVGILYDADYGVRMDKTPIRTLSWRLAPRNLAYRCLKVVRFAAVAVRKPFCRHVRHFTVELSNAVTGQDMSLVSAAIHYRYQARDR